MPMPTLQLKVARVSQLTPDVASFRLEPAQGGSLPTFAAGAHIDVHLADDVIRQYSLCNCPTDSDHYLIAVKRELNSRGGSKAMHEIRAGSMLRIGTPRNSFPICEEADFHLLLAGGIGITPLLSMARYLQNGSKPFQLEYFGRSANSIPFFELIADDLGAHSGFNIGFEPDDVRRRLASILRNRPAGAHVYICGPSAFISTASQIASQVWPSDCVHFEHFSPQPNPEQDQNRPFRVALAQANREFEIPADKSILDVLLESHIPCDFSCREGTCGSCMVAVLDGEVEHRDSYLSACEREQGEVMMICVSRAKHASLKIDL